MGIKKIGYRRNWVGSKLHIGTLNSISQLHNMRSNAGIKSKATRSQFVKDIRAAQKNGMKRKDAYSFGVRAHVYRRDKLGRFAHK